MFLLCVKRITKTYLCPGTTRSFLKLGLQKGTILCFHILMGKQTHNPQAFHQDLWGCSHEGVRFLVLSLKQASCTWKGLLRRVTVLLKLVILMEKVLHGLYKLLFCNWSKLLSLLKILKIYIYVRKTIEASNAGKRQIEGATKVGLCPTKYF